jgi:hypothetical protein
VGIALVAGLWYWRGSWHSQDLADPLQKQVDKEAPAEA